MRFWLWVVLIGVAGNLTLAQEPPKADELQKMYDDALAQLKAAQDRKNELGVENEQLQARLAEAEKRLAEVSSRAEALQIQVNQFADKTFQLRSFQATWREFLQRYPALNTQWQVFLENELLSVPQRLPEFIDPNWPLSARG